MEEIRCGGRGSFLSERSDLSDGSGRCWLDEVREFQMPEACKEKEKKGMEQYGAAME